MTSTERRGIARPRHGTLVATHQTLRTALRAEQDHRDTQQMVQVLAQEYAENEEGLAQLLANLHVSGPTDLLEIMRMLTLSASYTALTWAGGIAVEGDRRFEASDVLNTSWAQVE